MAEEPEVSTPEDSTAAKKRKLQSPVNTDVHPYARGSVIEVYHHNSAGHEDWWSEPETDDDEDQSDREIRLADVIDRVENRNGTWRYYIHYKDLNRRMDEWINIDRIVSPPSVGNAKARVLLKRQQHHHANKAEQAEILERRTRLRKKDEDDKEMQPPPKKDEMVVVTDSVTTQTVGQHVVATVQAQELDEHEGLDEESLREHEEVTKVKNVGFMELGQFQMETWYFSPIPKELLDSVAFCQILYVCEFTLQLFNRKSELQRWQTRIKPDQRHPPGNEIYRKGNLAMFEVDGLEQKIYCQNLCYIAKLFLDHKTLYYDVDPFLFYVLCEVDERGFHPVGYYSKEKYSDVGYNLACILTFPAHQRKGYGRFLISFSYELSKKEYKVGSPEKPMSDLGQQAYKPYWASTIVDFLLHQSDESFMSIMDVSKSLSIMAEDIVYTLNQLGLLKIINGVYFCAAEKKLLEGLAKKYPVKEPRVDPSCLHWTPFWTEVKRDKFSIHSKKPSLEAEASRGPGGFD